MTLEDVVTPEKIRQWARAGESEKLEFKESTGQRRAAARTLCAMLNRHGGRVLFGVENGGRVVGQQVGRDTLGDLQQEIRQIEPTAYPSLSTTEVSPGRSVVVASVEAGASRPYRHRGTPYQRVGSATVRMDEAEGQRILLERMHSEVRWENQPADGWRVSDLDHSQIVATVEEGIRRGRMDEPKTRKPKDLLRGLGLLLPDGRLTRAAVVLFGDGPRFGAEFTQCLLKVARFRGTTKSEFLDNRQFHGNAFELMRLATKFFMETLPIAGRVLPNVIERVDEPLYPPEALREAVANAICHRDYTIAGGSVAIGVYDDRLEVTSTGPLHFGLTPEELLVPHTSKPWNPYIAKVFHRRGVIEKWGRGTLKMAALVEQAGLPKLEIEDAGGAVTVRFRHARPTSTRVAPSHMELLRRIQSSLLENGMDLPTVLLMLRMLAARLGSKSLADWVEYESEGYPEGVGLPSYRVVPATYTGTFPLIKNAPIAPAIIEERVGKSWTHRDIRESITEVNSWSAEPDSLLIDTGNLLLLLQDDDPDGEMSQCISIVGHIPRASLKKIQYMVRKRILDFTLALERSLSTAAEPGVELPSTPQSDKVAQIVSQKIYGNVTNVSIDAEELSVVVGPTDGLVNALINIGIKRSDAKEFANIVASEGPGTQDPLGKRAKAWVKMYLDKVRDGALGASGSSIWKGIVDAVSAYHGFQ